MSELVGAARGGGAEGAADAPQRHRARPWQTRAGELELAIPKLGAAAYFPSFLEPRRVEQALLGGAGGVRGRVSTRKVEEVVESPGQRSRRARSHGSAPPWTSRSTRPQPAARGRYPYLWLDAKVDKVRDGGRVVRKCHVPHGVPESGDREVIGLDVGEAGRQPWRASSGAWLARPRGVGLVVCDPHRGLNKAIGQVLGGPGSGVGFISRASVRPRSAEHTLVGCAPLFDAARRTGRAPAEVIQRLRSRFRRWRNCRAKPRTTCWPTTPSPADDGRSSARPTPGTGRQGDREANPGRRHLPDRASLIRLVGMVLAEQDDEWQDGRRYFRPETIGPRSTCSSTERRCRRC